MPKSTTPLATASCTSPAFISSSRNRASGCAATKWRITPGRMRVKTDGAAAMRIFPPIPRDSASRSPSASSKSPSNRRAIGKNRSPVTVNDTCRVVRSKRAAPVTSSNWRMVAVIAGDPSPRAAAAALNDPCSATATNTRIWRILSDDSMILDVHSSKCAPAQKDHSAQSRYGQKASCVFYIAKRYFKGHSGEALPPADNREAL